MLRDIALFSGRAVLIAEVDACWAAPPQAENQHIFAPALACILPCLQIRVESGKLWKKGTFAKDLF